MKDPYSFDFIELREAYDEKELKDALCKNIERFLLELGNGFAYVGREVRLSVEGTDLYCDLLFYNIKIHAYVVVEIKTTTYKPEYLGQLLGYVGCANHILKGDGDNPTVGLLICKDKNNTLAKYTLEGVGTPLGISEYELSSLMPEIGKGTMPTIEQLEEATR